MSWPLEVSTIADASDKLNRRRGLHTEKTTSSCCAARLVWSSPFYQLLPYMLSSEKLLWQEESARSAA